MVDFYMDPGKTNEILHPMKSKSDYITDGNYLGLNANAGEKLDLLIQHMGT